MFGGVKQAVGGGRVQGDTRQTPAWEAIEEPVMKSFYGSRMELCNVCFKIQLKYASLEI